MEEVGSGARNVRPGWQRVLEVARRGGLDRAVVWQLDRDGRSTLDLLANIEAFQASGVRSTAVTQGLGISSAGDSMSRLLLTMLTGVAEFERVVIRSRTLLGLAAARRRGIRMGGRPVLAAHQVMEVSLLRACGSSWTETAAAVSCSTGMARRASERGYPIVGKPATRPSPRRSVSNGSPAPRAGKGWPGASNQGPSQKQASGKEAKMRHRHLTTEGWTPATIDSCIVRGGPDGEGWVELRAAARADAEVLHAVQSLCRARLRQGRDDPEFYDREWFEAWLAWAEGDLSEASAPVAARK